MATGKYGLIDLFCGCGGLTLGFMWDGLFAPREGNPVCRNGAPGRPSPFSSLWSNDFNESAIHTYSTNFGQSRSHAQYGSIEDILDERQTKIPNADVVMGGPPCQGFSLLNKAREGDARRTLWWRFMQIVEISGAATVVMENVPQLLDGEEFDQIKKRFEELGFNFLVAGVLCAADYGVPQTRQRAIILASKLGPVALPMPTHLRSDMLKRMQGEVGFHDGIKPWRTVRDAFKGLPDPKGTEIRELDTKTLRLHFGRTPTAMSMERYAAVPPGGNRFDLQANRPDITPACWIRKVAGGTDLFGRLWWDRPSVTIRTEFYKPEKGRYLHPEANRPITHREAARIQSFPDRFDFKGNKVEIAKQIGNAVPPLMAHQLALAVENSLEGRTTVEDMQTTASFLGKLPNSKIRELSYGKKKSKR